MLLGFDGDMAWFFGVVEDRMDPLNMGRLRVRVMYLHSAQKSKDAEQGIPTNELLWMHPLQGITSAAMSGIGYSPTGVVEGTHVCGFFRDAFCQDGIVVGTLGGMYNYKPDTMKGFCDPSGRYPLYLGNDVNVLAGGGQKSESLVGTGAQTVNGKPADIYIQEETTTVAVKPNDGDSDNYQPDDSPEFTLEKMLRGDEGYKLNVYWDHLGYPTVGIGHLILMQKTKDNTLIYNTLSKMVDRTVPVGGLLTPEEVTKLFNEDIVKLRAGIIANSTLRDVYLTLNASRRMALENMCFQMGTGGVAKFKNTLAAMKAGNWKAAYDGMLNSAWAKQTPGRANRVAKVILTGNLESYGVVAKPDESNVPTLPIALGAPEAKSISDYQISTRSAPIASYADPDDPSVPVPEEDTRIMFTEPKSAYAAQYPYNHVYQSESGHVQEFDDTPGAERYRLKHTAGTYVEIRPDGTRVTKIIGEDYLIVQEGQNVNIKGNLRVVIEGDAQVYNMGNVTQTVDGNLQQVVRGNVIESVDGNVTQTIKGSVNTKIRGSVTQEIDGNVTQAIKGNATQTIDGDNIVKAASWTANIDGNIAFKAGGSLSFIGGGTATLQAGGTATVSGSTINLN